MHILPHPSTGVQAIVHRLGADTTLGSMDTTNTHHDTSEDAEAPDTHVQTADNTQARETASVPADSSPTEDSPAATVVAEPATASSYPTQIGSNLRDPFAWSACEPVPLRYEHL